MRLVIFQNVLLCSVLWIYYTLNVLKCAICAYSCITSQWDRGNCHTVLTFCILGFDQHNDWPHFLSAAGGPCCLLVLFLALLAGSATPNRSWSRNHWHDSGKKTSPPWHSLHRNLSSHHWLSLISVGFSLLSPYGLTCFYHNCSHTIKTCACFEYSHKLGRSMKGCFKSI